MRVLVTGGAGFIGSFVVDELVQAGHDVVVLDALLPAAHETEPTYLNPAASYHWDDVNDLEAVTRLTRGVEAVSHQAAMVGLGVDFADAPAYVRHNDLGTVSLLRALHGEGFAGPLVIASSMVVYGEGGYECAHHGSVDAPPRAEADLERGRWEPRCPDCGGPLTPVAVPETTALDPRNVYASTKVHQEHLARDFAREHPHVTTVALRYHNVYGPRMPRDTPYAGVASIFRSALERGEAPRVFEDGGQLRDFVHVRDVAHANVLALTTPGIGPGAYNVASGHPRPILDMASTLWEVGDRAGPPPEVVGGYRLGDVRHVFASPELAHSRLGYLARIEFADGMREFAAAELR